MSATAKFMLLDANLKAQLQQYLALLEGEIVIKVSVSDDKVSNDMLDLVTELENM